MIPAQRPLPTPGDTVGFVEKDGTVTTCHYLGHVPTHPVMCGLSHPRDGDIVTSIQRIRFPLHFDTQMPDVPKGKRAICAKCRWFKKMLHPTAQALGLDMDDVPTVATCWQPTWLSEQPQDYVTGLRIPLDCYSQNPNGACEGFEPSQ